MNQVPFATGFLIALLATLWCVPALAAPEVIGGPVPGSGNTLSYVVNFRASDNTQSRVIRAGSVCSARFIRAGSDVVELYSAPLNADTTSGVLLETFNATSTVPTSLSTGAGGYRAISTTSTTGGSQLLIDCSIFPDSAPGVTINVGNYAPAGDGVTDDSGAFNAAAAALAAGGGGTLYIPEGDYCLGETGATRVYSGLRITSDNTFVQGAGQGRTILRPCGDEGNYAVTFCKDATNASCTTGSSTLFNVGLPDVTIKDEDTCGDSGHVNFDVVSQSNLSGGTPAQGDAVTWDGGASSGEVYCYQASTGNIGIHENVGSLTAADVITDGVWSATADSVEGPTTEESHGVIFRNVDGGYMTRVTIDGPADEGLDCANCDDMLIQDVRGENSPRHLSAGSALANRGGLGLAFGSIGADVIGGDSSSMAGSTGGMLTISTNSASTIDGVMVSGSRFVDTDTGDDDLTDIGVIIASNQAAINGVLITNSVITVDAAHPRDSIATSGGSHLTELAVTNSEVNGSVLASANHIVSFTNVIATAENASGGGFAGIDTITGGSYDAGPSAVSGVYVPNANGVSITGAKFSGSPADCINLNDYSVVTGVVCDTCGGGAGDHCVNETRAPTATWSRTTPT